MRAGAASAVLSVLVPQPATAHDAVSDSATQPDAAIHENCYEVFPQVTGDIDAAKSLVPKQYRVMEDLLGAYVLIAVRKCDKITFTHSDVDKDGQAFGDADDVVVYDPVDSYIALDLAEAESNGASPRHDGVTAPHGSFIQPVVENGDGGPGLMRLEFYVVQWVTNNKPHAQWLERSGALPQVAVVPGLQFNWVPPGSPGSFRFVAPAPAPSPFEVEAVVTPSGDPVRWDVGLNLWFDNELRDRTVVIHGEHYAGVDQEFGLAEGRITSTDSASPLGQLFADRQTRRMNERPHTALFSNGSFSIAQWTRCLLDRNGQCPNHAAT